MRRVNIYKVFRIIKVSSDYYYNFFLKVRRIELNFFNEFKILKLRWILVNIIFFLRKIYKRNMVLRDCIIW